VIILTALNSGDILRTVSDLGVQELLLKAEYTSQQLLDSVERLSLPPAPHRNTPWQSVRWLERN
jgi:hypothetical protein